MTLTSLSSPLEEVGKEEAEKRGASLGQWAVVPNNQYLRRGKRLVDFLDENVSRVRRDRLKLGTPL